MLERFEQIPIPPVEGRSMKNTAGFSVKHTGDHDTNTLAIGDIGITLQRASNLRTQRRNKFVRTDPGWEAANVSDLFPCRISDHDERARGPDIDRYGDAVLGIDIQ